MDKIYNLTIDTKRKSYNKILGIKQNENNVVLNITLVQNSMALDLTDCTVRLNYLNNNNVLLQMTDIVEVKEGKVKVNVLTKVLKDVGETPVDISIFDKDNRKITSSTFIIVVQASIYTNDKLDKEELDLIQDIYTKEETRILNEETRQANEKDRKSNEDKRTKDENVRNQEEIKRQSNEKIRIENEENRVKAETNRSDTFDLLKQQTEENIETQNKNIAIQEKEIQENKEINSNITTAEKERVINENNRQQGYSEMKNTINDFSICEIYNSDKKYKKFNRVVFNGSSYECLKECQHIEPSNIENWICIAQKGQGDMHTNIYDKNNNGIVDDSERLGNIPASMYIQKQKNTTWQDVNINGSLETGDTETLKLHRPNVTDKILLEPFNDNFTKLDSILSRLGVGGIKEFSNLSLTDIKESGVYLIHNLLNAPDTPPSYMRDYLVEVYKNNGGGAYYPKVFSLGTGKMYSYSGNGYEDIPCTSSMQPSEVYIDAVNGNDDNKGDKEHPIKTWECAYSRIPKILIRPIEINFLNDCEENIILDNISTNRDFSIALATWIFIKGNNHTLSSLTITDCHTSGGSWGISLYQVETKESITVLNSSVVNINVCEAIKIVADDSVIRCDVSTIGTYVASNRSFIQVDHHTTPEIKQEVGCHATFGSTIYVQGTHPQGSTGEKYESTGGRVEYES